MKRYEKLKGSLDVQHRHGHRNDGVAQDKRLTRRAQRRHNKRKMEDADQHRSFYG